MQPLTGLAAPLAKDVAVQPYVQLQTLFDAAWPPGRLYYIKSSVVRRLEEAAIEKYLDCARTMPTPLSAIAFQQLHGAASRVRFDDTAFPHRYDHYNLYIQFEVRAIRVAHRLFALPASILHRVHIYSSVDEGLHRVPAFPTPMNDLGGIGGIVRRRMTTALKRRFDPTNFLTDNQNIKPSA